MKHLGSMISSLLAMAQEASDIVIMDDNFASIVSAVLWGRCVTPASRRQQCLQHLMLLPRPSFWTKVGLCSFRSRSGEADILTLEPRSCGLTMCGYMRYSARNSQRVCLIEL